jgi:predicted metalloprotease
VALIFSNLLIIKKIGEKTDRKKQDLAKKSEKKTAQNVNKSPFDDRILPIIGAKSTDWWREILMDSGETYWVMGSIPLPLIS